MIEVPISFFGFTVIIIFMLLSITLGSVWLYEILKKLRGVKNE